MSKTKFAIAVLLSVAFSAALAESPLGTAFDEMRRDPNKLADSGFSSLFMQELPSIDRDSVAICTALTDTNAQIRLKASAIYLTIIRVEPKFAFLAQQCTSGLLKAASESEERIRNNALFVLAMNPTGILPGASDVFRTQLNSPNLRSAEMAAAGLLHTGKQDDQSMVVQSLLAAPDKAHRINMLYAISGSKISSYALFDAASGLLSNEDADVQEEAINAMVSSAPSRSVLSAGLDRINSFPSAAAASKRHARLVIENLRMP